MRHSLNLCAESAALSAGWGPHAYFRTLAEMEQANDRPSIALADSPVQQQEGEGEALRLVSLGAQGRVGEAETRPVIEDIEDGRRQ